MGKWFGRKGSQGLGLKLSQWVESQSCCWLYFYKKTDYQIWFCAGHFSETIFKSSNTQQGEVGVGGGGECCSFKLTNGYFWETQGQ